MSEENWLPVEVKELYKGYHVAVFRNERGKRVYFRSKLLTVTRNSWMATGITWI